MKSSYYIQIILSNSSLTALVLLCIFTMSLVSCQENSTISPQTVEQADSTNHLMVSPSRDSLLYAKSIDFREEFFQYLRSRDYESASRLFQQELTNYENTDDPCLQFEYLYKITNVLYLQEDHHGYVFYISKLLDTINHCETDDPFNRSKKLQNTLANLGIGYLNIHQPDSALQSFSRAFELNQTDKELYSDHNGRMVEIGLLEFYLYGNLGRAYLALGDTLRAEQYWKHSINLADEVQSFNNFAYIIRLRLVNHYIQNNRLNEAKELIEVVEEHQRVHPSDLTEERLLESRWKLYDQSGETEEAYQAYMDYIRIQEKNAKNRVDERRFSFDQEIRIAFEKHRAELLEAETRLKKFLSITGFVCNNCIRINPCDHL